MKASLKCCQMVRQSDFRRSNVISTVGSEVEKYYCSMLRGSIATGDFGAQSFNRAECFCLHTDRQPRSK